MNTRNTGAVTVELIPAIHNGVCQGFSYHCSLVNWADMNAHCSDTPITGAFVIRKSGKRSGQRWCLTCEWFSKLLTLISGMGIMNPCLHWLMSEMGFVWMAFINCKWTRHFIPIGPALNRTYCFSPSVKKRTTQRCTASSPCQRVTD